MIPDELPERPLVAVVGPTGAGKSVLSVHLASRLGGEIVNCDSLQLYRGFDIGTAKPQLSERLAIPHHLFDVLDPQQGYSAGEYARQARKIIRDISQRERLPVVTGGTGFYLRALLSGLPDLPQQDPETRRDLQARESQRPGSLHRLLLRLDPAAAARIHSNDVRKVIRALEVRILTRKSIPPPISEPRFPGYRILQIGLDPARLQLNQALDKRAIRMFQSGLLQEVASLLATGCSGSEKPFESLGYKQALQHIRGDLSLEEAIASTQLRTRQYAKRQLTWFRRDPQVKWLFEFGHSPSASEQCLELVQATFPK